MIVSIKVMRISAGNRREALCSLGDRARWPILIWNHNNVITLFFFQHLLWTTKCTTTNLETTSSTTTLLHNYHNTAMWPISVLEHNTAQQKPILIQHLQPRRFCTTIIDSSKLGSTQQQKICWHWHVARIVTSQKIYGLYARKHHIVEMRGDVTDAGQTTNDDKQLKIELLS